MNIAPDWIAYLGSNEVFVFGSNRMGRHGKGAAKMALRWGARPGQGEGLMGRTYGIPTKGHDLRVALDKHHIDKHVQSFICFAKEHPELTFLVTEIGCGLSGYKPKDIAPMFLECMNMPNVHLPKSFHRILRHP